MRKIFFFVFFFFLFFFFFFFFAVIPFILISYVLIPYIVGFYNDIRSLNFDHLISRVHLSLKSTLATVVFSFYLMQFTMRQNCFYISSASSHFINYERNFNEQCLITPII